MQRELYFHILKKDEVMLREATEDEKTLPPLKNQELAYFKSECTHPRVLFDLLKITVYSKLQWCLQGSFRGVWKLVKLQP